MPIFAAGLRLGVGSSVFEMAVESLTCMTTTGTLSSSSQQYHSIHAQEAQYPIAFDARRFDCKRTWNRIVWMQWRSGQHGEVARSDREISESRRDVGDRRQEPAPLPFNFRVRSIPVWQTQLHQVLRYMNSRLGRAPTGAEFQCCGV